MSPIKFEDNIQKKLESRTIVVSDSAWENVEKRIETFEKSKGKSFWRIGIAASILIAGWLTIDFVDTSEVIVPKVVVEPELNELELTKENESIEEVVVVDVEKSNNSQNLSRDIRPLKIERFESQPILIEANNMPIKVVSISTFEDQKIKELVAQVLETNSELDEVTDIEIEDLILQAQMDIQFNKMFNESQKTVSADELLYEIEFESDKSFRDKVFKELKTQFKSMKNAVAQRNK